MISARVTAAPLVPARPSLRSLREAASGCRACPLWKHATQTVFGEGHRDARVILVGEQPGNEEDLKGRPFVGPAGRLLDEALQEAGIARGEVYVTNVVKHFKWKREGKVRLHKKPNHGEIRACLPWLQAELRVLRPRALLLLGATAAQALLGASFRVTQQRGRPQPSDLADLVMATVHPSSVLRAPTHDERQEQRRLFVRDLRGLARRLRRA